MNALPEGVEDPEDRERALVKLHIEGPQDVCWAALIEIQHYIDETEGLEAERPVFEPGCNEHSTRVHYALEADRTGVIAPAIDRICDVLRATEHLDARIGVPGYNRTFYGWERSFVKNDRVVGQG